MSRAVVLALGVALGLAGAGCKKDEAPGAGGGRPEPIGEVERTRGGDACRDYVARLCGCAKTRTELAYDCELHRESKREALGLAMALADDPEAAPGDVAIGQDQARKLMASCVEGLANLDAKGCP